MPGMVQPVGLAISSRSRPIGTRSWGPQPATSASRGSSARIGRHFTLPPPTVPCSARRHVKPRSSSLAARSLLLGACLGFWLWSLSGGGGRVLRARASIQKRAQRWELRLETLLAGEPGGRTLAASTCADAAAAAALSLAFAIDPAAALKHSAPAAAPPPPPPAPAAPKPPPPRVTPTYFGVA